MDLAALLLLDIAQDQRLRRGLGHLVIADPGTPQHVAQPVEVARAERTVEAVIQLPGGGFRTQPLAQVLMIVRRAFAPDPLERHHDEILHGLVEVAAILLEGIVEDVGHDLVGGPVEQVPLVLEFAHHLVDGDAQHRLGNAVGADAAFVAEGGDQGDRRQGQDDPGIGAVRADQAVDFAQVVAVFLHRRDAELVAFGVEFILGQCAPENAAGGFVIPDFGQA